MRNCLLFLLAVIGMSVSGCKKAGCFGVICPAETHCEKGGCVCDNGSTGYNCDITSPSTNIKYLTQHFVGTYHVKGYTNGWVGGVSYPNVYIDTMLALTLFDDTTLTAFGRDCRYTSTSNELYLYKWMPASPSNYTFLRLKVALLDSIFFEGRSGGLGGGYTTYLSGAKVP